MPLTPVLTFRTDACGTVVGINTVQRNALAVSLTSPGHPPEALGLLGNIDCWSWKVKSGIWVGSLVVCLRDLYVFVVRF